jgi:putative ABC transport system permease protein
VRVGPIASAAAGALARRRVQTVMIGVVLLISAFASVLAVALIVDSNSPFDKAFAAQHGAQLTTTVNASRATPAELAATTRLPQVTAAA